MAALKLVFVNLRCLLALTVMLSFAISVSGCGGAPKHIKTINFSIRTDAKSNSEKPVYLLIRQVSKKSFLIETYGDVAELVFAEPRDKSILAVKVLLPERKEKIKLEIVKPEEVNIGVYALFEEPGEHWKVILETPFGKEYSIAIKNNILECR